MKVLATGASGRVAQLVVPALTGQGVDVRGMVHDPDKAAAVRANGAVETVIADLSDGDSVRRALDGVDAAFLITPAFHPDATAMGVDFVDAAADAGLRKIVYSGVYHPSLSLPNHASTRPIEEAIYHSGLDFTVLQPAMFMQAFDSAYEEAVSTGRVTMPWSRHSRMTYVDYRDVAEVAARACTDDDLSYGIFELAAGGMITRVELAELISRVSGRTVEAADPPVDASPSSDQPDGLHTMFADYDQHGFHGGNSLMLRTILQRAPRSIADYIGELVARN